MKYSKQRNLIEQTVKDNNVHPTADDVYALLKPANPTLSLGTVYRNLNVLAGRGNIRKLRMANGSDRFDGQLHDHCHVACDHCGAIFDVELPLLAQINEQVQRQTGVNVTSCQLVLQGVCKRCQA